MGIFESTILHLPDSTECRLFPANSQKTFSSHHHSAKLVTKCISYLKTTLYISLIPLGLFIFQVHSCFKHERVWTEAKNCRIQCNQFCQRMHYSANTHTIAVSGWKNRLLHNESISRRMHSFWKPWHFCYSIES